MDDQGQAGWEAEGHPAPTWWRTVGVVGALVVVAIAVVAASGARQGEPLVVGSQAPTDTAVDAAWSVLDRTTDSVLYLADTTGTVRVLDVDRRRVVGEVPLRAALGDHPFLLERVGPATVLQADDGHAYAFGGGPRTPVDLGRSLVFLPTTQDRVWTVTGDSYGPGGGMRVRHVDLEGRRIGPATPVPTGTTPVAAQGDRVLLDGDDMLRWWTPGHRPATADPRPARAGGRSDPHRRV